MILVFGAGQLGHELETVAQQSGIAAVRTDRDVDIADERAVGGAIERVKPDFVVNAAAYTAVDRAETEPELAHRSNAVGPAVIADACARAGIALVHISTDYVFDGTRADGAYAEDDAVNPLGVYGRAKLDGERAVRARLDQHLILRTAWVFGVYGRNFLKTIMARASEQPKLRVVADQHGSPTATADLAEAILRLRAPALSGDARWGTYHFAGSGETTWHGFASRIVAERNRLTGANTVVEAIASSEYPTAARRPLRAPLDSSLFTRTFGLTARHWTDATDATVAALLAVDGNPREAAPGGRKIAADV
jgi:dTDP-4-dehydrorhamnose reductase